MDQSQRREEQLTMEVQEQKAALDALRQTNAVPIVQATVVESSGSNDPMGTSVTSLSLGSSWQLAEPLAVAGVLLNERQSQVFLLVVLIW